MEYYELLTEFVGLPVEEFDPDTGIADPEGTAYRVRQEYDEEPRFVELWERFLDDPQSDRLKALIIGRWDDEMFDVSSRLVVERLVAAAGRLTALESIFLGNVLYEESMISDLQQSDVSPLWSAYPQLKNFYVYGGWDLSLGQLDHATLQRLVVITGGLESEVVQQVCQAKLPKLRHLELWLGEEGYGRTATLDDLQPLLSGELFPKLTYLGLANCEFADELAEAAADAPILDRLETLDFSGGTLGDQGAQFLLESARIKQLKKLDLHHHFLSESMIEQLQQLPLTVDLSEVQSQEYEDDYRYVQASE